MIIISHLKRILGLYSHFFIQIENQSAILMNMNVNSNDIQRLFRFRIDFFGFHHEMYLCNEERLNRIIRMYLEGKFVIDSIISLLNSIQIDFD